MKTEIVKNKWIKNDDRHVYSEEHGWVKENTIYTYYPELEKPYCFIYNEDWQLLSVISKEGCKQMDLKYDVSFDKAKEFIMYFWRDIKMELEEK